jgi:hypothetical protein
VRTAAGVLTGILGSITAVAFLTLAAASCKDSGSTGPPLQGGGPSLVAAPPSASVGNGTSVSVSISGGQEPYAITSIPVAALARAVWVDSTHTPATLTVFGAATVATGSTAVIIKDSSPSAPRTVTIPIVKN